MKLQDILAISGQPGLYKYVAPSPRGIIVESLADGKRMNAASTAKVSSMAEIAVYTDTEDIPLSKVLESLFEKTGGKEAISHKSPADELKALFAEILPTYDRDRVNVSDMKKIVSWYNILVGSGMTDFSVDEDQPQDEPESGESAPDETEMGAAESVTEAKTTEQ